MAKIGVMSFAHMHALSYAACLNELAGAELAAIWDDDPRRGREQAAAHRTKFVENMDDFLALDMDGVIVASENVKHRAMVEKAAAAGKWILCEKPLAPTVEDCRAMVDACKKAGVGLGTAFPCRYIPSVMAVKEELDKGVYGEIYAASCTNNGQFPGGWFAKRELAGGGATMDHTVHVADLLRWMLNREFTRVYCENGNLLRPGIDVDDVGSLHMEMEGGVIVSHIASWNRAASFPTWGDVTLELIGEKGVVAVDAFNQKLHVYDDAAMKAAWNYWGGNPDLGLIKDFVAAVDEKRDPAATGVDGMKAVEVTVAAYKSASTHRMVPIG
ncbi:MAG TPA: Gfo/Idh/MocA family oxidoreductase [Candidatus Hydrogenedentes bacterium]|nr:Gfo/Idh/MocA family oxidoreductase [Candidatus Hydrogenedentota bacterium]